MLWLTGLDATLRGVHLRRRGELLEAGAVEDFAALDLALADTTTVRVTTSWDASTGMDAQISLRIHTTNGSLELVNREESLFHFDARRCFGTSVEHLAADDTDRWQAGPLLRWLRQVRAGEGFREPAWLRATTAVIDQAYAQGRPAAGTPLLSGPLIPETGVVA